MSMNLRLFIRQVLSESILQGLEEAKIDASSINPNIGLFLKVPNNKTVDFTLYDPTEDVVYGHMGIYKLKSGNWAVGGIGAEYGYGPLMYELAMSFVFPAALMPTRDGSVRSGAVSVWEKFISRSDVSKEKIPMEDSDFSEETYEDMGDDPDFDFIQTRYYYDGAKNLLHSLMEKGMKYQREGVDLKQVDRKGNEYWLNRYD